MAIQTHCPAGVILQKVMNRQFPDCTIKRDAIKQTIQSANTTRRKAYYALNPTLMPHAVYTSLVPEHHRIAFTRLRLSSHNLPYEMGRWARIPPENRMCPCGSIQTDTHVILECEILRDQRFESQIRNCLNLADFFDNLDIPDICKFCKNVLDTFN